MQNVWNSWFPEMCRKTLIKKACSSHFKDEFTGVEEQDNENYDPNITTTEERNYVEEINKIDTLTDLVAYFKKNEGKGKDFASECTRRKKEIQAANVDPEKLPE